MPQCSTPPPSAVRACAVSQKAAQACVGSAGMPVGVQVVGLPFQDELCLGAMRAVQQAVGWSIKEPRQMPFAPRL